MRKFFHQRCTDEAAAQTRRRLSEDKIVLLRVFAMAIDNRIAATLGSTVDQWPIRSGDERGSQSPALHDRMHDLRAKNFIINAHSCDPAAPTGVSPKSRCGDCL